MDLEKLNALLHNLGNAPENKTETAPQPPPPLPKRKRMTKKEKEEEAEKQRKKEELKQKRLLALQNARAVRQSKKGNTSKSAKQPELDVDMIIKQRLDEYLGNYDKYNNSIKDEDLEVDGIVEEKPKPQSTVKPVIQQPANPKQEEYIDAFAGLGFKVRKSGRLENQDTHHRSHQKHEEEDEDYDPVKAYNNSVNQHNVMVSLTDAERQLLNSFGI